MCASVQVAAEWFERLTFDVGNSTEHRAQSTEFNVYDKYEVK